MSYRLCLNAFKEMINDAVLGGCCEEDPRGGLEIVLGSRVYRLIINELRDVFAVTLESGSVESKIIFLRVPLIKDDPESISDGMLVVGKLLRNSLRMEERDL